MGKYLVSFGANDHEAARTFDQVNDAIDYAEQWGRILGTGASVSNGHGVYFAYFCRHGGTLRATGCPMCLRGAISALRAKVAE